MNRLRCVPKASEIADLIVPHLQRAERAIASFGQGCEGEPLVNPALLLETVRLIRSRTKAGTLHLNTNASKPAAVRELIQAGLDSIRVSLCSARRRLYEAYTRPSGFSFDDVAESIRVAKEGGAFVSLNYFVFPGVTDQPEEIEALLKLIGRHPVDFIQMRNMNMDPDEYLKAVGRPKGPGLGIDRMMEAVHRMHPRVRFGYYNPPKEGWGKAGTVPPEHLELSKRDAKARARFAPRGNWKKC